MHKIILLLISFLSISNLQAQQEALFTQNTQNVYLLNPASYGAENKHQLRLFVRQNWMLFKDAPLTFGMSYQGLIKEKHGVGGLIYLDQSGPFQVLGIKAGYAFHIPLSEKSRLSLGLTGKYHQTRINSRNLVTLSGQDASIDLAQSSAITGDAEFGIYYYSPRFYAGLASSNLIQSRLSFTGLSEAKLYRHYYANMGLKIPLKGKQHSLEPFINARMVNTLRPQVDVGLQVNLLEDAIQAGVLYRSSGAVGIYFAGTFDNQFLVSFSLDFITGNPANYSALNYETVLGYDFPSGR